MESKNKTKEELEAQVFGLGNALEDYKKENKILNKKIKHTKNTLFNFRQECYSKMVSIDYGLYLSNDDFSKLFEKLINRFRKHSKYIPLEIEMKGGKNIT